MVWRPLGWFLFLLLVAISHPLDYVSQRNYLSLAELTHNIPGLQMFGQQLIGSFAGLFNCY